MANLKTYQAIPHFSLYGESPWLDDPTLIHSENIARRSSPLGWVIDVHRHDQMYQCLLVIEGEVKLSLDDNRYTAEGPCLVWIPPGVVHSFQFSDGTQGAVVSTSQYLLTNMLDGRHSAPINESLQTPFLQQFNSNSALWHRICDTQQTLQTELDTSHYGKSVVCESLMLILVVLVARCRSSQPVQRPNNNDQLFNQFQSLVDQHYRDHLTTDEYAIKLNVTPSKLNRTIKLHTQLSAKQFVQQRVIMEIKRKLLYTRQSADAIAYEVGFKDPGYFSRFFKRLTGETPGKFRRGHRL